MREPDKMASELKPKQPEMLSHDPTAERRTGRDRRKAERSIMAQHVIASNRFENKYRHLRKADGHLRAEIKISRNDLGYQFKLQEIDEHNGSFFINENSVVLNILDVGTVLDMKYWTAEKIRLVKYVRAQIKDITRQNHEPFKGHYKVGISILKMKGLKRVNPTDRLLKAQTEAEALMST